MSGIQAHVVPGVGGGIIWTTLLDINFADEPSQTIATDGDYTIGGHVFTKINSANDASSMVVVNGSGLVVTPKQATDNWALDVSLPALTVPFASLIDSFDYGVRVRVWMYIANGNWAAQWDSAVLEIGNLATNTNYTYEKVFKNVSGIVDDIQLDLNGTPSETFMTTSNNVHVIDIVEGVGAMRVASLGGAWAAGWPAASVLLPRCLLDRDGLPDSWVFMGKANAWAALIGAHRAGSATAFVATIGALKIEYAFEATA